MSQRSQSFDAMAANYDRTRVMDAACLSSALGYLADRFPPEQYPRFLEPGAGTGRIAIPLCARGYRITAVDISSKMLESFNRKAAALGLSDRVGLRVGDVAHLPFGDASFDLALAAHLFYHVGEWRRAADELLRVVRRGGAVIIMHTGTGLEIPVLNQRYEEACRARGYEAEFIGVQSNQEVADHYLGRGCTVEWVRDRWTWLQPVSVRQALTDLQTREYAFTARVPEHIHTAAMDDVREAAAGELASGGGTMAVPNQLYFAIVSLPGE